MDIHKGDIVAWPTNLGWMMGPWLIYASLLNGASMALYNGSPLGSGFAKFVQVNIFVVNTLSRPFFFSVDFCTPTTCHRMLPKTLSMSSVIIRQSTHTTTV
jgi:hypothetical protein